MPLVETGECSNCGRKHAVRYSCECGKNQWCLSCGFGFGTRPCDCDGPVFFYNNPGLNKNSLESLYGLISEWNVARLEGVEPHTKDLEHWIVEEVAKLFGFL